MTCYNCKYYGKCDPGVKICTDHKLYATTDEDVVINIIEFNSKWIYKHKKWYWRKLDPSIMIERIEKKIAFLQGKKVSEWIKEKEDQMYGSVIDETESIGQNT